MQRTNFKYVDLFAGIGGFHAALDSLGGQCVYAVEIDRDAARIYESNWGTPALGDITKDANEFEVRVPAHDVLVAGFPCQPFSKSGRQMGMEETRGTLYWNILKIIEERKPKVVLLENVRNLAGPRHAHEWDVIVSTLREQGYLVSSKPAIVSPHELESSAGGRPQTRERVFITASYAPDRCFEDLPPVSISNSSEQPEWSLIDDLPLERDNSDDQTALTELEIRWISAWDEFIQILRAGQFAAKLPGFPIWADAFILRKELRIPDGTPSWKRNFLLKNSALYSNHQSEIDEWARKWGVFGESFPSSRRKLEWQAQDANSLWDTLIQLRPSGIRVKKPTYVPALVAITQTSIVGPLRRRLSVREAARLQGFPDWFSFGEQPDSKSYKQLGNGVNIGVVWFVLAQHVKRDIEILKQTTPELVNAVLAAPQSPDEILNNLRPRKP